MDIQAYSSYLQVEQQVIRIICNVWLIIFETEIFVEEANLNFEELKFQRLQLSMNYE